MIPSPWSVVCVWAIPSNESVMLAVPRRNPHQGVVFNLHIVHEADSSGEESSSEAAPARTGHATCFGTEPLVGSQVAL